MKKKYFYYVLVFTNEGAKYVTSVNNASKMCKWDELEKPLEFTKEFAESIVLGLCLNFFNAVIVTSLYKLDSQAYLYNKGHFKWVANK